jgi:hypothetical protein
MINIEQTKEKLEKLATDLDASNTGTAARLRELRAAIGGDSSIGDWVAADIHKVINADAIAESARAHIAPEKWLRAIEWLRNVMILLPLIITWYGISQAADKYEILLKADITKANLPFLFLWQQGFNNTLWPPLILSHLAFWDVLLLICIFGLTGVVTWRYSIINAEREKQAEQLRQDITYALGDAQLCLTMTHRQQMQKKPQDIAAIGNLLVDIADSFKSTSDTFIEEMRLERQQRGSLDDYLKAMDKIAQDILSATNATNQTSAELTSTIKRLAGPIQEIPAIAIAATRAVTELNTMTNTLGQLVGEQALWRQELQSVLASKLDEMHQEQKNIGQQLYTLFDNGFARLATEQKQSSQELHTLVKVTLEQGFGEMQAFERALYNMLDKQLQQLLAEQKRLGSGLIDAADTLEETGKQLTATVKTIEEFAQRQEKVLALFEAQQISQRELIDHVTKVAAEIGQILRFLREAVPELRSMSVDIDKFVNSLKAVPKVLQDELLVPLKHYSSAAAKINTGAVTLEKAAIVLNDVANKLDGSTGQLTPQP